MLHAMGIGGVLVLGLLSVFMAGCGASRMATATASDSSAGLTEDYRLSAGDEVLIDVFREPELSGRFRVEASGGIRHPILGAVDLGGLTASEAEQHVLDLLGARYMVNPQVMLHVVSSQAAQIVVLGEVKSPGVRPIPFNEPVTLLQVIAGAGGFTELASVNRVKIVRSTDGRQKQIRVRVASIIAGQEPDVSLEPNDVVMVPQTVF